MRKILFIMSAVLLTATTIANNISVSNTTVSGLNVVNKTLNIGCDVAIENSWRTNNNENNYDGAWMFLKYRVNGTSQWRHCTLKNVGAIAGDGATISVAQDQKGAFLYRAASNVGIGNVNFTNNRFVWHYGADGVADNATVEIKVFALEMVYVPTGDYWLGSGGTEANCFKTGNTTAPYKVTSPGTIPVNTTTGLSLNSLGTDADIPATFPNAHGAYWVMKYECSQQQYTDFLNSLGSVEATSLIIKPVMLEGFAQHPHPNYVALYPDRALGFLNEFGTKPLTSFAEWSGLRPMSEMEFEKASRGVNIIPVPNEYVWGSTYLSVLTTVANSGLPNETISGNPADANAQIAGGRPTRVGIFARTVNSTRELSGATYYGIMNMSDNVFELTVSASTIAGRTVNRAVHGGGYLDLNGNSLNAAWVNPTTFLRRGTSHQSSSNTAGSASYARLSNRAQVITSAVIDGIRLARTAD